MTENTEVREVLRWSKCSNGLYLSVFVFGLLFLVTSAVLILIVFAFMFRPCKNETNCHRSWGKICGGVAVLLFLIGVFMLLLIRKRRQINSPPQVVVSEIPAQDVEKTSAFIPSYNCTPHCQLFDEACSTGLPDYFTAVQISSEAEASSINSLPDYMTTLPQNSEVETFSIGLPNYISIVRNIDDVYLSVDLEIYAHDVPRTPPPCYEQALKMATLAATSEDVTTNFEHGNARVV